MRRRRPPRICCELEAVPIVSLRTHAAGMAPGTVKDMRDSPEKGLRRRVVEELRERLETMRRQAVSDIEATGETLRSIEETKEAEAEERSQEEDAADRLAPLGEIEFQRLRQIDGALSRIAQGTYGTCLECGKAIAVARLRADPAAASCRACARGDAAPRPNDLSGAGVRTGAVRAEPKLEEAGETEFDHLAAVPPELRSLDDAELAALVRQSFGDEVAGLERVRVVCRHGFVILGGEVGSDELRQVAVRIVEDEIGLEVIDRMLVSEFAAESGPGTRARPRARGLPPEADLTEQELAGTRSSENILEVEEEGLDFDAPSRPVPESD